MNERWPRRSVEFAKKASLSLLKINTTVDRHKLVYRAMSQGEQIEPQNREEVLLPEFIKIANERNLTLENALHPYWSPDKTYDPLEMFGTLVQFADYHDGPLPSTTLPPEKDVTDYINWVMNIERKATLPQQFEKLLDITGNKLMGAANLGLISSRIMARGLETRAYPNIHVGKNEMFAWNDKIAQFEVYGESDGNDGPGDTYYFWTHMCGALYFTTYEGVDKNAYDFLFEHGTEIMRFARKWIAGDLTNSQHQEATLLGRNIGLALAETAQIQSLANQNGRGLGDLSKTLVDYLFTNKEYTSYQNPDQYEEGAMSKLYRRDNLARGVADVIEANSADSKHRKLLDIGAGTGILTLELAKRGFTTTALDLFVEQLGKLQEKAAVANLGKQITTVQADMNESLPFQDNSFDAIISLRVTRYIADFDHWLSEVRRVLEPNGVFVLPTFLVDTVPWKRHSKKGIFQETSVKGMTQRITNAGFEVDRQASKKYEDVVDIDQGKRDVPFYYKPTFIVAKKSV